MGGQAAFTQLIGSRNRVMRGQKRVEDARKRAYAPRIHLLREKYLRRSMDCRVKPGNDDPSMFENHGGDSSAACSSAASTRCVAPEGCSSPMRARQSRSSPDGAEDKNPRA